MEKEGEGDMRVKSLHESTHGTNIPLASSAPGACGQEGAVAETESLAVVRGGGLAHKGRPQTTSHTAAGNRHSRASVTMSELDKSSVPPTWQGTWLDPQYGPPSWGAWRQKVRPPQSLTLSVKLPRCVPVV